jgi:hypothetical protein
LLSLNRDSVVSRGAHNPGPRVELPSPTSQFSQADLEGMSYGENVLRREVVVVFDPADFPSWDTT